MPIILHGRINGRETRLFTNPDAGASYRWVGQGKVKPLGVVAGTGVSHGVGFIQEGTPAGTMTLSSSTGTITLTIKFDRTRGFAPLPSHAAYVITGGTGAYTGARGSGSLLRQQGSCSGGSSTGLCPTGGTYPVTYRFSGGSSTVANA